MKNLINIAKDYIVVDTEAEIKTGQLGFSHMIQADLNEGRFVAGEKYLKDKSDAKVLFSTNPEDGVPLMLKENVEKCLKEARERIRDPFEKSLSSSIEHFKERDKNGGYISSGIMLALNRYREFKKPLSQRKWTDEEVARLMEFLFENWVIKPNPEFKNKQWSWLIKKYLSSLTPSTEMIVEGEEKDGIFTITKIIIQ